MGTFASDLDRETEILPKMLVWLNKSGWKGVGKFPDVATLILLGSGNNLIYQQENPNYNLNYVFNLQYQGC